MSSGFGNADVKIGDLNIKVKGDIEQKIFGPAETQVVYTVTDLNVSGSSGVAISGKSNTAQGFMQSLGMLLKKKPSELEALQEKQKSYEGLIEQQKKIKSSKFEYAEELDNVIKERDELKNELANEAVQKGKDEKHLTLAQAASMLGLNSDDFLVEDEQTEDLKLSAPGDRVTDAETILKQSNDLDISQMVLGVKATNQSEALESLMRLAGSNIKNRETGIDAQINSIQRNKLVSKVALSKSKDNGFSFEDHFTAVANIDQLFENGSMVDDRPDKDGDPNVLSVKRFSAPIFLGDEFAEAYITVKETVGNKIYSIELDEIKKPSDITGGTLKERYHIPEGYNNLLQKIEKARELLKNPENSGLKASMPNDRQTETEERLKSEAAEVIEPKLTKEEQKLRSDLDDVQKTTMGKLVDILLPGKSEYLGNMFKK